MDPRPPWFLLYYRRHFACKFGLKQLAELLHQQKLRDSGLVEWP